MFDSKGEDDMVECPYNKLHRMLRKRLAKHLIKCRVYYRDVELQKCPFNNTHLVPDPEFINHVNNCPDRKLITQHKFVVEPKLDDRPKQKPVETDENWDSIEVEDYDPKKYLKSAPVLRRPDGICPSERREFIKNERKRLGYDESVTDSDRPSYSGNSYKCRKSEERECTPPPPPIIENWPSSDRNDTTSTSLSVPFTASRRFSSSSDEQTYPSLTSSTELSPFRRRSRQKSPIPCEISNASHKNDEYGEQDNGSSLSNFRIRHLNGIRCEESPAPSSSGQSPLEHKRRRRC
uniref:CHHC U11-48K-type domain-containing protein n=1 Tax=Glossina brevipalpis TaxID=37001 RepID=A0A1A9W8I0_9MUSC